MLRPTLFTLYITAFLTPPALAQDAPYGDKLPLWEIGVFGLGVTQPAFPGSDDRAGQVLALPYVIYRGKYLRADRGSIGVRAIKTPRMEADLGFAASLGSNSSDSEARRGMADLGTMVEFGPRLKINLGDMATDRTDSRIVLPLRGVFDITDHFRSRGISFEPQWVTDTRLPGDWLISTSLGALFGDQKLNDTFYSVTPSEATSTRPSYAARSGLIALRVGLIASHSFTPDIKLYNYLRLDSVADAANRDSPLVRRNGGLTVGVGIAWTLGRSARSAND
jgi:outer membrane scaffolding protein for murein synthesis (MipA/OmpV family)